MEIILFEGFIISATFLELQLYFPVNHMLLKIMSLSTDLSVLVSLLQLQSKEGLVTMPLEIRQYSPFKIVHLNYYIDSFADASRGS